MFANGKTDRYVRNRGRERRAKKPKRHRRGFVKKTID